MLGNKWKMMIIDCLRSTIILIVLRYLYLVLLYANENQQLFQRVEYQACTQPPEIRTTWKYFEGALLVLSEFGIRKLSFFFFRRTKRTYLWRIDLRVSHFSCFSRNRTHFRRYNINAETSMNTESGNQPLPIY